MKQWNWIIKGNGGWGRRRNMLESMQMRGVSLTRRKVEGKLYLMAPNPDQAPVKHPSGDCLLTAVSLAGPSALDSREMDVRVFYLFMCH